MMLRLLPVFCLVLLSVACAAEPDRSAVPRANPQILDTEPLTIRTAQGQDYAFAVEVARTMDEQAIGLMNRTELAADGGMLFDFTPQRDVGMWMRNTYIPLDMLFADREGVIVYIAAETVPHSEKIVSAGQPVRAVLELKGGLSRELGIREGDRLLHPIFDRF